MEQNNSNVSNISETKKESEETNKETENLTFEEIAKRNKEKADRIKRERAEANLGVIRSYRLKR